MVGLFFVGEAFRPPAAVQNQDDSRLRRPERAASFLSGVPTRCHAESPKHLASLVRAAVSVGYSAPSSKVAADIEWDGLVFVPLNGLLARSQEPLNNARPAARS